MNLSRYFLISFFALTLNPVLLSALTLSGSLKKAASAGAVLQRRPITEIKYRGKTIKLGDKALYLNARLKDSDLGTFAFKTLQDVVKFAGEGTQQEPTVIYMEPNVYWTDDPSADNKENKLIGLKIPQANITLVGLSENAEHTIIAGNRGQMAGAIGNWNTLGVGDGFKAYNITFGNYCNEDLVYTPDPSKNFPKRQSTITQAQVLTKAHNGKMDKWIFENCRFISYLNTFAAGDQPHRTYYKNCFLQCTDDAVGSGDISVFDRCSFRFYSNHPSWGGSRILQAYLGCKFETVLRDPGANSTIYFAKNNNIFALIDAEFRGNATRLAWTDVPADGVRHYVHNNVLNGQKAIVSETRPELSIELTGNSLAAFKVGDTYNIYNLLRGNDDWDPAEQKSLMSNYKNLPFRIKLTGDKVLDGKEQFKVSYVVYPERVRESTAIKWSVSDESLLSLSQNADGSVLVKSNNRTDSIRKAFVRAETQLGIQSLIYFDLVGVPQSAPMFAKKPSMRKPRSGILSLSYELNLKNRQDNSLISWYRSKAHDARDSIKVAVSAEGTPLRDYRLSTGDIGYYLLAKILPKHNTSNAGAPIIVRSRMIDAGDIPISAIETNFENLPTDRNSDVKEGFWTVDTYRPTDLSQNFPWTADGGKGWEYGRGSDAASDREGLMTAGRGARLLYTQSGQHRDMSVVLQLSPHKAAGQGFGSATGQYLDIYTKFDTKTITGYGLRLERTPKFGNGVRFALYKFRNGVGTQISDEQYSSAFLPGCKVELSCSGTTLTAKVTSSSPQQQGQKDAGLKHEVYLQAQIAENTFGGFGVQHTGSTGGGSRVMLENLKVRY